MQAHEALAQSARIEKFNALGKRRTVANAILNQLEAGAGANDPFNTNTGESRLVASLQVKFTPTVRGSPATEMQLGPLNFPAHKLGDLLKDEMRSLIEQLDDEIEAI